MEKVLFVGGDKRSVIAFEKLKEKGYTTDSLGLFENDRANISNADVLVFGIPTTRDKETVFCPQTNRKILLSDIKKNFKGKYIISGGYTFENFDNTDVLSLDSYCFLNAVPTAEGAIAFAIQNTDFTLWKSKVLIIGNGRVGKILISRLKDFGCNLTVSARKQTDFSLLETQNISYIKTDEVSEKIADFDIVFNTIDINLFSNLSPFKKTLLIDLSSKGCIDYTMANTPDLKAFKLPSLPSKTAQQTAGIIFFDTILRLLESRK